MYIIDRYLLRIFWKTLLVLFLSTTGLYVMVDTTNNFEELVNYGKENGGFLKVLGAYYGPRVLTFFDRSSSVLSMVAAMFVVSWMYRTNELTAIMAGGIPKSRVARPLIAASLFVSLLGVVNREWAIPQLRERLIYNAQNWKGENPRPLTATYDNRTEILLDGKAVIAARRQINEPKFVMPGNLSALGPRLIAARAIQRDEEGDVPAGYLFEEVQGIANLAQRPDVLLDGEPIVYTPLEHDWLQPNQVFIASGVEFEQLAAGPSWHDLASTLDLVRSLRSAAVDFGPSTRVRVHARLLQPIVDMTLVLIGLPLVLRRAQRNIFMAVGTAMFVIASFFTITVVSHGLGSIYWLSPALAAWLPLMIFVPLAALLSRGIWEP
ncbi:MAG: LptF/LptG family permease [Pirellulales bacterium]